MKIKRLLAIVALFALGSAGSALAGPKEDALAAYLKFFTTFTTDNQEAMVKLFAPDVQFFGTSSPEVVTTHDGIRAYFTRALSSSRGVVGARAFEQTVTQLSDDVVLISGKWQSERTLDSKMTTGGPSRNTVVMRKIGDRWLIAQFHNSPTPKPPAQ